MGRITREAQSRGGRAVVEKYGTARMKKMGRRGAIARWAGNKKVERKKGAKR